MMTIRLRLSPDVEEKGLPFRKTNGDLLRKTINISFGRAVVSRSQTNKIRKAFFLVKTTRKGEKQIVA